MPGYDQSRFIDLNESMAKHLECCICLGILNNAVSPDCNHSFCKDCIKLTISARNRICPHCKTKFKRKRANSNNDNLVIIGQFVFKRSLLANGLVDDLTIKCEFESKGCKEVMKFVSIKSHLKECEHNLCPNCDIKVGNPETHNCVELLKNDRNQSKTRFDEFKKLSNDLATANENLGKQVALLEQVKIEKETELATANENLGKEVDLLRQFGIEKITELAKLKSSFDDLATSNDDLVIQYYHLAEDRRQLKTKLSLTNTNSEREVDGLKKQCIELKKELVELKNSSKDLIEKLEKENQDIKRDRDQMKTMFEDKTQMCENLTKEVDALSEVKKKLEEQAVIDAKEIYKLTNNVLNFKIIWKDTNKRVQNLEEMNSALKEECSEWQQKYQESNEKLSEFYELFDKEKKCWDQLLADNSLKDEVINKWQQKYQESNKEFSELSKEIEQERKDWNKHLSDVSLSIDMLIERVT